MSGLLRRLASQTIGGGQPTIRPLARLPWTAPLELTEDTAAATEHGPTAVWPAAPGEPPAERGRVQPPATLAHRSPRESPQLEPLVRSTPLDPSFATVTASTPETGLPTVRVERTGVDDATAAPTDAARAPDVQAVAPRALPQPGPPRQPAGPGPGRLRPTSQTDEAPLHLPTPMIEETVVPVRVQTGARPRIEPASYGDAARASAHEPSEVHVHIGRIEVTAVHEAPPAREKKRAARQPMSLEAYLAKRHGRAG